MFREIYKPAAGAIYSEINLYFKGCSNLNKKINTERQSSSTSIEKKRKLHFSKMVQNAATSPDREERVANIAQALHQQSFGKPMAGFSEKDLHSQWFENLFKDIHEKAMMGIRKLESPALQAKYLDELLEEYPARLSDLQQHRVQVSKMSKVLAAPIVSVKDLASSAYDVVTRKHVNSISPAEINSSHDLGVAVGKLNESLSGPLPSPANNTSTPQVVVQNTRP